MAINDNSGNKSYLHNCNLKSLGIRIGLFTGKCMIEWTLYTFFAWLQNESSYVFVYMIHEGDESNNNVPT